MNTFASEADFTATTKAGVLGTKRRRTVAFAAGAVLLAAGGVVLIRMPPSSVATDNAYLRAESTAVSAQVRGVVAEVLAPENSEVRAGQPLVRLNPVEYRAKLAAAEANLAKADAELAAARAGYARSQAEADLARALGRQAAAEIRSAEAQALRARTDSGRYEALAADGAVARREAERARADAITADAAAVRAREAEIVSRAQVIAADRRASELAAGIDAALAERARALAALDLARRDADDTLVSAPVAGVVGDRKVNIGDYVQPGTRLMTIVPTRALYLTANFKETQTGRIVPGQAATVRIDALPDVRLRAHVQSVAPASGSQFALLPFEPGVGNFTKIVQRVTVRLAFEPGQPELARLRPGLSARVKVRLDRGPHGPSK